MRAGEGEGLELELRRRPQKPGDDPLVFFRRKGAGAVHQHAPRFDQLRRLREQPLLPCGAGVDEIVTPL